MIKEFTRSSLTHPTPEGGSPSREFVYRSGQVLTINPKDEQSQWLYRLKVKAFKIKAWVRERVELYRSMGYRFLAVCLTFRDDDAYIEFEKRGGRRAFMDALKKSSDGKIIDYVLVAEFQERGTIHYHMLLVVDGWIGFPDQVVKMYRGLGMSNVKELRKVKSAVHYIKGYLKKLKQLSLEHYKRLKAKLGGIKVKLRLYEFGRPRDDRNLFSALNKGWIRYLYGRVLSGLQRHVWKFKDGWLCMLNLGLRIKAEWSVLPFEGKIYLQFRRFLMEQELDDAQVVYEVNSLDDLSLGIEKLLFNINHCKEV